MRVLSMSNFASNPPHHSPSQSFDRANADKFMQELKEKAEQAVHDMPGGFGQTQNDRYVLKVYKVDTNIPGTQH